MEFKDNLIQDIRKELVQSSVVLNGFLFLDSWVMKSSAFVDPSYLPFYYYLSKYVHPRNLLEVGFSLGLHSGAFLRANDSVERFLAYQSLNEQPCRLGSKNIWLVYKGDFKLFVGSLMDCPLKEHTWDLVLWDKRLPYDEARSGMDRVWDNMSLDGWFVFERFTDDNRAFLDFCKVHQREPVVFPTRYGVGIIRR
jgi:hypothetical protein